MDNITELNLDDMENVSGGAGAKGAVTADGIVVTHSGAATYQVNVGGQMITASLSGKMRMNFVRVLEGDRVRVEYVPGSSRGRITYRYR